MPRAAFADLLDPHDATIRNEKGTLVLRINGLDGAEGYFADIFFDRKAATRRQVYSLGVLTSETRYFAHNP